MIFNGVDADRSGIYGDIVRAPRAFSVDDGIGGKVPRVICHRYAGIGIDFTSRNPFIGVSYENNRRWNAVACNDLNRARVKCYRSDAGSADRCCSDGCDACGSRAG